MTTYLLLFLGWTLGALLQGFARGGRPGDYRDVTPQIVAAALLIGACWVAAGCPR